MSHVPERKKALCQKEALCHKEKGDEGTTDTTTANLGATTLRPPRGAGWTGMLDGTSRPTNPEYEPDGIHIRKGEPPHRP